MKTFYPDSISKKALHQIMLGTITPRPIAFVSTVDNEGIRNLAPFSYFNAISSNPPMLVLSVNRNTDGSKKDTLLNIEKTGECVVNMVDSSIANQMVLASTAFSKSTDEFMKSGLTPISSSTTKAYGVKESPVRFECKLERIINFGDFAGASSLIICNVSCVHIEEKAFDKNGKIDPVSLNIIGRLGRAFYVKTTKESVFSIPHLKTKTPLGFDNLPTSITNSKVLSGNDISKIAGLENLPTIGEVKHLKHLLDSFGPEVVHQIAGAELQTGDIHSAAKLLMTVEYFL